MHETMHRLCLAVALVGSLLAVALWTSAASACSCRPPPPPDMARDDADLVFEGRTFASSPADEHQVRWEFEVIRYWKGEPERTVTILSASNSAMCGRTYEPGTSYLLYAREQDGQFKDNLCSRTRPVAAATEDLEILGKGQQPEAEPPPDPATNTDREPPRIETQPQGPPPPQPGRRGCNVGSSPSAPSLIWLGAAVAFCRRRAVASLNPTR